MTEHKVVNGVNVDDLFNTINAIKDTPTIAKFRFKADNKWIDGGLNRTTVTNFYGARDDHMHAKEFELDADEPPVLLGKDQGPNPVEYLLTALASCVTTSIVYHAAAKGITINTIESRLEGDIDLHGFLGMDPNVRRGYENIRMVFRIDADAPAEELEEIVKLGPTYSPVYDSVTNGVPVTVEMEK